MGGLGNGRRGGRSPPLMIGALIACILVLGFNYWVSSSRNLELQTKLYELEGQMRRGAAERGAAEVKKSQFQEEIQKQKEQMIQMENLFKRDMEGAKNTCTQDKETLQQNISSSTKTIQELKGHVNQLNNDLGKLQKELESCQGHIKKLNNKLTYDMTNCHSQVLSQKELCNERVEAAKLEIQKKMTKLIPPPGAPSQAGALKQDGPLPTVSNAVKISTAVSNTENLSQAKEDEPPELLTNEIIVDQAEDAPKVEPQSVPSAAAVKKDILLPPEGAIKTEEGEAEDSKLLKNNLTEDKEDELMGLQEEGAKIEETDPGMEGMLMAGPKADENPVAQKSEEPEDYDADEQIMGEVDGDKQQQSKQPENIDLEQELADYNGDDENEGEFEADKQAALAQT